jgi:hypothetical protein
MRTLIVALVATASLFTVVATSASAAPVIDPTGKTGPATATKQVQYHPGHRHSWHHRDHWYSHGYGSDSDAAHLNRRELNRLGVGPQ